MITILWAIASFILNLIATIDCTPVSVTWLGSVWQQSIILDNTLS